jgi:hypothetical protein
MDRMRRFYAALFVVAVCSFMGACSSSSVSITLTPSAAQAIDVSQTVTVSASVLHTDKGVTWTLNGPGSLSGTTGLSVVYTPGTQTGGALPTAQQATVTATSISNTNVSASVQITVNPYPNIPFQTIHGGTVGTPYSQPIVLTGGTAPFQWSIYTGPVDTGWRVAGGLPDGLTLNPTTGVVSGTPTAAGTWFFEATVTDAVQIGVINGFLSIQIDPTTTSGTAIPFLNQSLVPSSVPPGKGSFTLKVAGTGFVSGAAVNFNGSPLITTFVDSSHLTATVPASAVANAGTAAITVANPSSVVRSNPEYFQIGQPQATVSFALASSTVSLVSSPYGIRVGDFNEDGIPDLAIAAGIQMFVYLGKGDGTFTAAPGTPMYVPSPPYDDAATPIVTGLVVGDFNNSGHQGVAVTELQNLGASIFLGNGDGTFALSSAQIAQSTGDYLGDVEIGDFNSDGNLDLAMLGQFSGYSSVDLGYGKGAFTSTGQFYSSGAGSAEAVGDFNQDGKLDVIVASGASPDDALLSGITVSLGNGDGTFTQGSFISVGSYLSAIVAADFNGDGKLDVAVTDSNDNTVSILLGNGDGTFGTPLIIQGGEDPQSIVAGDFNNDGKLDLAILNAGTNGNSTITLLLGNGDGTFTQAANSPYPAGQGTFALAAADFNGDGKLDLAVVNPSAGTATIMLQQ